MHCLWRFLQPKPIVRFRPGTRKERRNGGTCRQPYLGSDRETQLTTGSRLIVEAMQEAGERRFNFAWGHREQQIAVVDHLDMVVVVTADPLAGQHGGGPWGHEKANLNLVGDFISSLSMQ